MNEKELLETLNELKTLNKMLLQYPAELRLAFALTALDEASEVLGITMDQINDLRTEVHDMFGDFYE